MELNLVGLNQKKLTVSDTVFASDFNEPLIHQVVTAFLAAGRAGTQAQKTRSAVRGGGIKPWNQKGSGRARAGTIRSPLWRKGGVIFAAQPRSYEQKVNKKMYRLAMRSILSELIRQERLLVMESFELEVPKTKELLKKLETFQMGEHLLIVTENMEKNLCLAARNLPTVEMREVSSIDPVILIKMEKVVMTSAALKRFEELLT